MFIDFLDSWRAIFDLCYRLLFRQYALVMPHMVLTVLATIFNILGWAMNKRGFALTGAILYAVAIVTMPIYFFFVIVQMVLSFVGFAKLKKTPSITE